MMDIIKEPFRRESEREYRNKQQRLLVSGQHGRLKRRAAVHNYKSELATGAISGIGGAALSTTAILSVGALAAGISAFAIGTATAMFIARTVSLKTAKIRFLRDVKDTYPDFKYKKIKEALEKVEANRDDLSKVTKELKYLDKIYTDLKNKKMLDRLAK